MINFEISGVEYRADKLATLKQFHISRKIAPLLPALAPVFLRLHGQGCLTDDLSSTVEIMAPFAEGIAGMPDDTVEYIIGACLAVIQRNQQGVWSPVWDAQAKACAEDIDMGVMMRLIVRVIQDSLGPFILGLIAGKPASPD